MNKKMFFVIDEVTGSIKFYVDGECIDDTFDLDEGNVKYLVGLMAKYADIPVFKEVNEEELI